MNTLAQYLETPGNTDAKLAELAKCDRSMITKIRLGQATPSLPLAIRINRLTGVPIEALMPEAKSSEARQ